MFVTCSGRNELHRRGLECYHTQPKTLVDGTYVTRRGNMDSLIEIVDDIWLVQKSVIGYELGPANSYKYNFVAFVNVKNAIDECVQETKLYNRSGSTSFGITFYICSNSIYNSHIELASTLVRKF